MEMGVLHSAGDRMLVHLAGKLPADSKSLRAVFDLDQHCYDLDGEKQIDSYGEIVSRRTDMGRLCGDLEIHSGRAGGTDRHGFGGDRPVSVWLLEGRR